MYRVVIIEDRQDRYDKLKAKIEEYPNLLELVRSVRILSDFRDFKAYSNAVANSQGDIYLVDWELELNEEFYTPSDLIQDLAQAKTLFTVHNKYWIFYSNSDKLAKEVPDYVQEYFGLDSPNTDRPGFLNLTENGRYVKFNYFEHSVKKAIVYLESFKIPEWAKEIPDSISGVKCVFNDIDGKFYNLEREISNSVIRHIITSRERVISFFMNGKQGVLIFIDDNDKVQFYFIRMNSDFKDFKDLVPFEKYRTGVFLNKSFFDFTFSGYTLKSQYTQYIYKRSEILKYLRPFNHNFAGSKGFSTSSKDVKQINVVLGKLYSYGVTPTRYSF